MCHPHDPTQQWVAGERDTPCLGLKGQSPEAPTIVAPTPVGNNTTLQKVPVTVATPDAEVQPIPIAVKRRFYFNACLVTREETARVGGVPTQALPVICLVGEGQSHGEYGRAGKRLSQHLAV